MFVGKTVLKLSKGKGKDLMTLWLSRKASQIIFVGNQKLEIREIIHPIKINRQFSDLYRRPKVTSLVARDLSLKNKKSF